MKENLIKFYNHVVGYFSDADRSRYQLNMLPLEVNDMTAMMEFGKLLQLMEGFALQAGWVSPDAVQKFKSCVVTSGLTQGVPSPPVGYGMAPQVPPSQVPVAQASPAMAQASPMAQAPSTYGEGEVVMPKQGFFGGLGLGLVGGTVLAAGLHDTADVDAAERDLPNDDVVEKHDGWGRGGGYGGYGGYGGGFGGYGGYGGYGAGLGAGLLAGTVLGATAGGYGFHDQSDINSAETNLNKDDTKEPGDGEPTTSKQGGLLLAGAGLAALGGVALARANRGYYPYNPYAYPGYGYGYGYPGYSYGYPYGYVYKDDTIGEPEETLTKEESHRSLTVAPTSPTARQGTQVTLEQEPNSVRFTLTSDEPKDIIDLGQAARYILNGIPVDDITTVPPSLQQFYEVITDKYNTKVYVVRELTKSDKELLYLLEEAGELQSSLEDDTLSLGRYESFFPMLGSQDDMESQLSYRGSTMRAAPRLNSEQSEHLEKRLNEILDTLDALTM